MFIRSVEKQSTSNHDGLLVCLKCCAKSPDLVPDSINVCQYMERVLKRRMVYSGGSVSRVGFAAAEPGTVTFSEVASAPGAARAYGSIVVPKEGSTYLQR